MRSKKPYEEIFIKAVIDKTAEVGIENLRTKEIAASAYCSEGALFSHYSTKEELLKEVYASQIRKCMDVVESCLPASETGNKYETVIGAWRKLFRYMLNNAKEALYILRYRQSSYYSPDRHKALTDREGVYKDMYRLLFDSLLDMTLCTVRRIASGEEEDIRTAERMLEAAVRAAVMPIMEVPAEKEQSRNSEAVSEKQDDSDTGDYYEKLRKITVTADRYLKEIISLSEYAKAESAGRTEKQLLMQ